MYLHERFQETFGVRAEPNGPKFVLFDCPEEGGTEKIVDIFDGERARWLPQLSEGTTHSAAVSFNLQ